MAEERNRKTYKSLGNFLTRNGYSKGNALSGLFIETFALGRKTTDWKSITLEDLKARNIIPNEKHKTFSHWRKEMLGGGILICMANKSELEENTPNYKANLFKCGDKIEKYINKAILENIPNRINNIEIKIDENISRVDLIENKIENKVDKTEFEELRRRVEHMSEVIMDLLPPDTPERRQIITENIHDKTKMFKLLNEQLVQEATEKNMTSNTLSELMN